jgi:hypothetical protein
VILTKDIANELRHFLTEDGSQALQKLGEIFYKQYAWDAVHTEGLLSEQAKGAAKFAEVLQKLPESLRDATSSTY